MSYIQKAHISTAEGQKETCARAGRISLLNSLNEKIRKLNPAEAWPVGFFNNTPDSAIDENRDMLVKLYNSLTKPQ